MRNLLLLVLVALVIFGVRYMPQSDKSAVFEQWKHEHGFSYAPEQQAYRRIIFEQRVAEIRAHNLDSTQTYTMGINQFTALTQEEFRQTFLGATPPSKVQEVSSSQDLKDLPNADVDWTTKGLVTHVKNQGQCGSCWAFAATGVSESWALGKGQKVDLSEQQLVDCSGSYQNHGCNGGWPTAALQYMIDKGLASSTEYPYVAKTNTCKKDGGSFTAMHQKNYPGCSGLLNGVASSPLSVTVNAENWSSYKGGIFNNCGTGINHAVLLVGVSTTSNFWKIKNSWGTKWGENGFIRLAFGNTCGVCHYGGDTPQ